jgi:hypothetical protein
MNEQRYLKVLNVLVRIVGVFWIFCGLIFVFLSIVSSDLRVANAAGGLLAIAGGIALWARPFRQEVLDWFKKARGTVS